MYNLALTVSAQLHNKEARDALTKILQTAEFKQIQQFNSLANIFQKFLERFFNANPNIDINWVYLLIRVVVILAGGILLFYLIRLITPFWKMTTADVIAQQNQASDSILLGVEELLAEAQRKANQGKYRQALRDMYLSLLLEMDRLTLIRYKKTKTNRDYLLEIRQTDASKEAYFKAMITLFEYKWYGLENCNSEDYQRGKELYGVIVGEGSHG